ncbi:MAG TPA: flippase [Terriglobales bacterium]|nr:flippase [Terriglobales bacterium]
MATALRSPTSSTTGTLNLVRNTGWNLAGQIIPTVVAVFTIPSLMRHVGTDRFGVLTIAWAVLAYFSLFDFGLGRAVTMLAAERVGTQRDSEVAPLAWTALSIMGALGILAGVVAALVSPVLIRRVFQVPLPLQAESIMACRLLGLSLPFVILTTGLGGIMGAVQRFDVLNQLRMPQGIFTYVAPWAVALFNPRLSVIIAVMVLGRIIFCFVHLLYSFRVLPELSHQFSVQLRYVRPLLGFGGWMTVSNVVGPVMMYFDRFLIGARLSVAAVAYYATPHEAVNRLLVVPVSISAVLFPAIASALEKSVDEATNLFARAMDLTTAILLPITAVVVMFANEGLTLWLGPSFAENSVRILQLLVIGVLINGFAQVNFAVVQGAGRADLTAKFHLLELPIYLLMLWYLLSKFGATGAALAWSLRTLLDMALLFFTIISLTHQHRRVVWLKFAESAVLIVVLVACMFIPAEGYWRIFALLLMACSYLAYAWRVVLKGKHPGELIPYFRMLRTDQ